MANFHVSPLLNRLKITSAFLLIAWCSTAKEAPAQTYSVMHAFSGGGDGAFPQAGLTIDAAGNFYGTAAQGGLRGGNCQAEFGCGVVFKFSHTSSGWVLQPLYTFQGGGNDSTPLSRAVIGPDGALYGTTAGYSSGCTGPDNCGMVYRVSPPPRRCTRGFCPWNESVLHAFASGEDGASPLYVDLAFDDAGAVYGTTTYGGTNNEGTVFQLVRQGSSWIENILYNFGVGMGAGAEPESGVIFDRAGNIFGATAGGGLGYGVVYELQNSLSGWTESTLYAFPGGASGAYPVGGLIFDAVGNLYGTTERQGPGTNGGTVYELVRSGAGWTFSTLTGIPGGAGGPQTSLVMDAAGNLYGTTNEDGAYRRGCVFKISKQGDTWVYTDLYDFTGFDDGGLPTSSVVIDANGNLWGTAYLGGDRRFCNHIGCGVIWKITP
jgi:uncharacterized repeat protein (TIGR03803 family)